jgi:hypothetical protein
MRHAEIGATMKYYVVLDAAEVADDLWAYYGNFLSGNIRPEGAKKAEKGLADESAKPFWNQ